jgi:hypothetical protein
VIGYVQVAVILIASTLFFHLPIRGSIPLLLLALGLFIGANLALGVLFSTVSANQMQGYAAMGAMGRRSLSDHACDADRARHVAEGQRVARNRSGSLADCDFRTNHSNYRRPILQRDVGLNRMFSRNTSIRCHFVANLPQLFIGQSSTLRHCSF